MCDRRRNRDGLRHLWGLLGLLGLQLGPSTIGNFAVTRSDFATLAPGGNFATLAPRGNLTTLVPRGNFTTLTPRGLAALIPRYKSCKIVAPGCESCEVAAPGYKSICLNNYLLISFKNL